MNGDLEALGEERRQQHLQAHQVLKLEVPNGGLAFNELLDELLEAVADSLPSEEVVRLDAVLHILWQEGLVAEGKESVHDLVQTENQGVNTHAFYSAKNTLSEK